MRLRVQPTGVFDRIHERAVKKAYGTRRDVTRAPAGRRFAASAAIGGLFARSGSDVRGVPLPAATRFTRLAVDRPGGTAMDPTTDASARTGELAQLAGVEMLTDGGIETTLIYHDGLDLPLFAAFPLLETAEGRAALQRYYESYLAVARRHGLGIVLESATWRANADWGGQLGYSAGDLDGANRAAIELLVQLREAHAAAVAPIVISGCVGPQSDGYSPATQLSAHEAQAYHSVQIRTFASTAADMVTAITMTYAEEAIGVTRAARDAAMPVAISFTVETDGALPSGQRLADAIAQVDADSGGPDYYMINCAHPAHFEDVLEAGAPWVDRIRGLRANASRKSHDELDASTELDEGDPAELADAHARMRDRMPHVRVLGGCCGTDDRHVDAIASSWYVRGASRP
jgi:S-methylmethionine-dependent homocysteine/selenocysteine methylase